MLLKQILVPKPTKSQNKLKYKNVKLNPTLHIIFIKVNKTIDIRIIML